MIAGDPFKRASVLPTPDNETPSQAALSEEQIGFNCLNYDQGAHIEGSMEVHYLRDKAYLDQFCKVGVRAEIQFPNCWNGKDLDSTDHKSHMAFGSRGRNGPCPEGFPVRIPAVFFETIYQTRNYVGQAGEFVLANGDPTGYGYHADFICGWQEGVLEAVLKDPTCTGPGVTGNQQDCKVFNLKEVDGSEVMDCKMDLPEAVVNEPIDHVQALPGDVQIYYGPERAPMPGMVAPSSGMMAPESSTVAAPSSVQMPASPASTSISNPDTSSAAAPPSITPAPSATPASTNDVITKTSVTISNGTVYHWVILEEILTTTVMVDTPVPTGKAKRHGHVHRHHYRR